MQQNKSVIIWLLSGCFLIFIMVFVGGITRLTDSGLSMSTWSLIGGPPPMNLQEWSSAFETYKQTPEGKVNSNYTLSDFKYIFFWEYLHRMLGRLLGIIFLLPFIYFLIKKKLSKKNIIQCSILLVMGASQGLIGWWMVKSGLVDRPDVSHYRLAVHLTTAFLTCSYTLWVALDLIFPKPRQGNIFLFNKLFLLFVLIIAQIVYGAFVAGLKAGRIYNTWPKMGDKWIPESIYLDAGANSQFTHRILGLIIVFFTFYIWKKAKKLNLSRLENIVFKLLPVVVSAQFILGVITLITGAPIFPALLHQILAFFLLLILVFNLFLFKNTKKKSDQQQKLSAL
ncbi:MAG: heme A synthase [Flavobacteriales bacterium]|nr:heme A synthase [Flavobacteriales bacterium]|tara:strand:- start:19405 stop:20421 length:1017 start_codon:yes stop_codon:yes gene_type:complete